MAERFVGNCLSGFHRLNLRIVFHGAQLQDEIARLDSRRKPLLYKAFFKSTKCRKRHGILDGKN